MNTTKPDCHILKKGFCNNVIPNKTQEAEYLKFWTTKVAYMNLTQNFLVLDNPQCVKNIIEKDYWVARENAKEPDNPTTTTLAINSVPSFFILFFLILTFF